MDRKFLAAAGRHVCDRPRTCGEPARPFCGWRHARRRPSGVRCQSHRLGGHDRIRDRATVDWQGRSNGGVAWRQRTRRSVRDGSSRVHRCRRLLRHYITSRPDGTGYRAERRYKFRGAPRFARAYWRARDPACAGDDDGVAVCHGVCDGYRSRPHACERAQS